MIDTRPARGYLDTPSMGLPNDAAVRAMTTAIADWGRGQADYATWERSLEACRGLFAGIMGVSAASVGLLPSVVPAVSAAAALIARGTGTVVVHRREFRSLLLPFLAQVDADRLRWVDGPYVAQTFLPVIDAGTDAVVVSAVSSHDGGRPSLELLSGACQQNSARLIVDGTQAAGVIVPDVALSSVTLFACAGYKGLRGPRGVAYAVAHDEVSASFAAPSAYGVADGAERGSYGPPLTRKRGASGLDQSPAWLSWVGAEQSLRELAREPATDRQRHVVQLAERMRDHLHVLGLPPQATDLPSPVVSFGTHEPETVLSALGAGGVRAAARLGRIRLGFHVYNDENDLDLVCGLLDRLKRQNAL